VYLKRLDVLGFKSFANKTTIYFSNGITSIVGPNGCGKTNTLDALRWVLGEQKVSLLRSSKMEEVIFNGTRDLKPLNMAEVTITLVNDRGLLPTEYNEVQVTRRLFRSGESEYLLNKVPCRLKDITELFLDTGVGSHSYSVIQQEMIEAIVSDKAEERRFLFEEAAGITKYKQRKKAALRKLEATENDLLRLNDIHAEVKTQVNSLKRQHRKAERYQTIVDDIKKWEVYLSTLRMQAIESESGEMKTELAALSDQRLDKEAKLNSISAQLEQDRKKQVDLEHELSGVGGEAYEISEKAHSYEKEISILTEKRANARALIERNQNDIQALQARENILKDQATASEAELNQDRAEVDSLMSKLHESEEAQAEADQRLLEVRAAKEQGNKKLIDFEGKLSSGRAEEAGLLEQQQELSRLLTELDNSLAEHAALKESLNEQAVVHQQTLNETSAKKSDAEKSQVALTERIEQLLEKNEELSLEISNLSASIEACEARRNLLEEMIFQYEGYESGVVAAMEVRNRFEGIVGTVAEKFVPVEGLETAVEAALGEMAGFIICNSRQTAERIIDYLKAENKGKLGILVPDSGTLNPVVKRPELNMTEFVGWMDGFISTDDELRPLMEAVISRTAVFKKGSDPTEILTLLPYGFKAVSTDGVVYSKNIIAGGSQDKFPLFRRKEKVSQQQQMIEELNEKLKAVHQERNRITTDIAAARAESLQLTQALDDLAEDLESIKEKHSETDYQIRTAEREIDRLQKERGHCQAKLDNIQSRQNTLGLDFEQLSDRKEDLDGDISRTDQQLSRFEEAASAALESFSQLQVAVVEAKSRVDKEESELSYIGELRQEIANGAATKNLQISNAEQEIETSTQRISDLEGELKLSFEQRAEVVAHQNSLRTTQSELLQRVSTREEQLKEIRNGRDSLSDRIHQLEIRLNTLELEIKAISDRIRDDYELDISAVEVIKPDASLSEQEAHEHIQKQKELLKKFGAVNLLALEEYQTTSEREKFLREQLKDLSNAKADLQATITKINQTARTLFTETLEKVRGNFKKLFVELFAGGEVDIFLEDPSDSLESNIEIIARPGRKKLLSINQMSGGERALTAISLLFSLYLVKPSPFCILDEIDSPLDDANCRRFLKIIDTFSERTQFVIITHNKITMEAAHNLYGVTMEQPGVSKLVAVKFTDVHEDEATGTVTIDVESGEALQMSGPVSDQVGDDIGGLPETVVERLQPAIPTGGESNKPPDQT